MAGAIVGFGFIVKLKDFCQIIDRGVKIYSDFIGLLKNLKIRCQLCEVKLKSRSILNDRRDSRFRNCCKYEGILPSF